MKIKILFILLISLVDINAKNFCNKSSAIFFNNGMLNTEKDALKSLLDIITLQGKTDENNRHIEYDVLYNPTQGFWKDIMEVFEQRAQEDGKNNGRYELFFDIALGNSYILDTQNMTQEDKEFVKSIQEQTREKATNVAAFNSNNPETLHTYAEHLSRVNEAIKRNKNVVLVAHSQGNLFAGKIYEAMMKKYNSEKVKVVHIAPASQKIYGDYILANTDIVIRPLLNTPKVTHHVSWIIRPDGIDGKSDYTGHSMSGTYLNKEMPMRKAIKEAISKAVLNLARYGLYNVSISANALPKMHVIMPDNTKLTNGARTSSARITSKRVKSRQYVTFEVACSENALKLGNYKIGFGNINAMGNANCMRVVQSSIIRDSVFANLSSSSLGFEPEKVKYYISANILFQSGRLRLKSHAIH